MGIKSLSKFLRENFPDVFEHIHISQYRFQKVAIDTSLYLCNYKALYGDEGWLGAFIKLVSALRKNDVHCVFIYDTSAPAEKTEERKERHQKREKTEERVYELEQAIERYKSDGEISDILIEFQERRGIEQPRLLGTVKGLNIKAIENAVDKMKKQMFTITPQDFELTRKLFDALKVPYYNAKMEAETMCSDLCIQGKVDAVLSEDTDVLAYGAPVFLTKFNTMDGTCLRVNYEKVLEVFNMTKEQFLDFCIMCGTDYNKNIFRVGPSKAYKLLLEHKSIEGIGQNTVLDISVLNHVRGRELFREYEKSDVAVPYCGFPDFTELQMLLIKKNVRMNIDSLKSTFTCQLLVFDEDDDIVEDEQE
jgi:flap endonuclease-1